MFKIKSIKWVRNFAHASVLVLSVIFMAALFPMQIDKTEATDDPEEDTVISVSASEVNISAVLHDMDGEFFSASTDISVKTNNSTGYTLRFAALEEENHDKLTTADGEHFISSISSNVEEEDFSTNAAYNGNFGFKPSKINSEENDLYVPAPGAEGNILEQTEVANSEDNVYSVALGARIDRTVPLGTYTNSYVFTAVANAVPYHVSYHDGTGDEIVDFPATGDDATNSSEIILNSTVPKRERYVFVGWCSGTVGNENNVDSCSGSSYQPGETITIDENTPNNISLEAMWQRVYLVSFDLNSGSGTQPAEIEVIRGDTMPTLTVSAPTRTGYNLTGWYNGANGGTKYYNADGTSARQWDGLDDTTLYAVWSANTYTIAYAGNGNNSGTMASTSCTYDQNCTLRSNAFAKTGYNFGGWKNNTTGSTYTNGQTVKNLATGGTVTLTAQWSLVTYSIGYTLNSGSVSGNPTSYNVTTATFTLKNPTRSGYTFAGWTGTGLSSATATVTISKGSTGNRSYTANWCNFSSKAFSYTGGMQSWKAPCTGTYLLEVYGAQGGDPGQNGTEAHGGKGGYSKGNKVISANTTLYIGVGKQGHGGTWGTHYDDWAAAGDSVLKAFNGGGKGDWTSGGGGGGTHIGLSNATIANTAKGNLIIVAGGGGGGVAWGNNGGAGGGATGGTGASGDYAGNYGYGGYGGSQSAGGAARTATSGDFDPLTSDPGKYGVGGEYRRNGNSHGAGGGGGGYYGGGGGVGNGFQSAGAGGGGSGYIGGVTNGSMSNGVQSGNGYAKITYVGP